MEQLKSASLACISKSELLIKQGKFAEAVEAASDSINLCPLDIAFLLRGEAYYRQASYENAIEDLKKAYNFLFVKLSQGAPDRKGLFFKTNVMLTYSLLMQGSRVEAELFFLEAQEQQIDHPSLYKGEMQDLYDQFNPTMQVIAQPKGAFAEFEEDKEQAYEQPKKETLQFEAEKKEESDEEEKEENDNTEIEEEDRTAFAVPNTQKRKQIPNEADESKIPGPNRITLPPIVKRENLQKPVY